MPELVILPNDGIVNFLNDGLRFIFNNSQNVLVNVYNYSITGSGYDDNITQTLTGSSYISGIILPIKGQQGSTEAMLMEQGKLLTQDKVMFTNGSLNLNGSGVVLNIGNDYYTIIPEGVTTYSLIGSIIYNKLYLRQTLTGSIWI